MWYIFWETHTHTHLATLVWFWGGLFWFWRRPCHQQFGPWIFGTAPPQQRRKPSKTQVFRFCAWKVFVSSACFLTRAFWICQGQGLMAQALLWIADIVYWPSQAMFPAKGMGKAKVKFFTHCGQQKSTCQGGRSCRSRSPQLPYRRSDLNSVKLVYKKVQSCSDVQVMSVILISNTQGVLWQHRSQPYHVVIHRVPLKVLHLGQGRLEMFDLHPKFVLINDRSPTRSFQTFFNSVGTTLILARFVHLLKIQLFSPQMTRRSKPQNITSSKIPNGFRFDSWNLFHPCRVMMSKSLETTCQPPSCGPKLWNRQLWNTSTSETI